MSETSDRLTWDYNVPINVNFTVIKDSECSICNSNIISLEDSAPFFFSNIPSDILIDFIYEEYNVNITEEEIIEHKKHIEKKNEKDNDIRNQANEQIKLIESDLPQIIKPEDAMESAIRSLYARKLYLEKTNDYATKEYMTIINSLKGWVEMKLKTENKIVENKESQGISLLDLIKIPKIHDEQLGQYLPTEGARKSNIPVKK